MFIYVLLGLNTYTAQYTVKESSHLPLERRGRIYPIEQYMSNDVSGWIKLCLN